jgi:hypothetical protein
MRRERTIMIAPWTSGKCPLNGRSIALAAPFAILMLIAPHEASAKGGIKSNSFSIFSKAEAATITSSPAVQHTPTFGGCGGKRHRDPITHQCRGPADFGH